MSWLAAVPVIGDFFKGLFEIVDKTVEDKDKANELKKQLEVIMENSDLEKFKTDMEARSRIIIAEAKGQSWLQRNWRPLLMLCVIAIIFNNYVLFPYLSMFTTKAVVLQLPDALFNLLTVGVGGYVVGRSAEKAITTWKEK